MYKQKPFVNQTKIITIEIKREGIDKILPGYRAYLGI
jgi:hypothetical protein